MSPLPTHLVDRWRKRGDQRPGEEILYWHVLMRGHPEVLALAEMARDRLEPFAGGFHFTPLEWLHITMLVVDRRQSSGGAAMAAMATEALVHQSPARVQVGRLLYHPEAIMLAFEPVEALAPFRSAAQAATFEVMGHSGEGGVWVPHITVAYSTADRPAGPIIEALGRSLPSC